MLDHFDDKTNVFRATTDYDAEGSGPESRHDNLLFSRFGEMPGWQYGQIPQPVCGPDNKKPARQCQSGFPRFSSVFLTRPAS